MSMSRWSWLWRRLSRRLWLRASCIGMLGLVAALLGAVIEHYVPLPLPADIATPAIESLLTIMATSMLAVTTFSLSVMTSAYSSATTNVTPRATPLLVEDSITQTVLSTFVGSFIFSIVGLIVLKTDAYGERGRDFLFLMTIAVIVLVVVSLLRWIDYLTRLGRVGETSQRVELATRQSLLQRRNEPCLGGVPWVDDCQVPPPGATALLATAVGYVQHIDMAELEAAAKAADADIYVRALPGSFVYQDAPLAWLQPRQPASDPGSTRDVASGKVPSPALPESISTDDSASVVQQRWAALHEAARAAITIDQERTYIQDPRFGLVVLCEIASRALSSGINDPGTAIDVIGRLSRVLTLWAGTSPSQAPIQHHHIHVPPLACADLVEDAFMLIARDGAGMIEVQLRLQKAFDGLRRLGDPPFQAAIERQAALALRRAMAALPLEEDRQRLQDEVAALDRYRAVG